MVGISNKKVIRFLEAYFLPDLKILAFLNTLYSKYSEFHCFQRLKFLNSQIFRFNVCFLVYNLSIPTLLIITIVERTESYTLGYVKIE